MKRHRTPPILNPSWNTIYISPPTTPKVENKNIRAHHEVDFYLVLMNI